MRRTCCVLMLAMGLSTRALADASPVFSPVGPDAAAFGSGQGYPIGGRTQPTQINMVGSFSHFDRIWPYRPVAKAVVPTPLHRAAQEISLDFQYRGGPDTLRNYLAHTPVTGLLIARDDTILFEHYQYGRTDQDRLTSHSMAKTVVAMLIGLAISEGRIHSVDDLVERYVPELTGTAFGGTRLRALLHMASGVAFREDYVDTTADNFKLNRALFMQSGHDATHVVAMFDTRAEPPDTRFNYASVQTEVLGLVLARAVGEPPSAYLQTHIWQPMGAEADATWTIDTGAQEIAYCCFNAVLRDWARLGLLLAHDGALNGRQIIPHAWLMEATTEPPDSPFAPSHATRYFGYGYQLWLFPGPRRQFAFLGTHGQSIYVDPQAHLVMVQTAAQVAATGSRAETIALWEALVQRYGD